MNTIGVAIYSDGTQGLIDLAGWCKSAHLAAKTMKPRATARRLEEIGMNLLVQRFFIHDIMQVNICYMDGRNKELFYRRGSRPFVSK